MRLQVIKRNGRFYFHVYLPKNIVEHVLKWERGEELTFTVIEDGLILRKNNVPNFNDDDWSKLLECEHCNRPTSYIKGVIKKNHLICVARCSKCKKRKRITLPLTEINTWLKNIKDMIERCDLCNEKTLKQVRVRYGYDWRSSNYAAIVYFCKKCGVERTKIIPYDILENIRDIVPKKIELPVIKCIYCGAIIKDLESSTCKNCGKIIVCKSCGNFLLEKSRYCTHCGEEIDELIDEIELEKQYCPFCYELINQGALFCERCGNQVSCIVCGSPIKESTNYCGQCGTYLKKEINLTSFIEKD
ncbi:MAG: double zinc ribbon domain-containing protein [Candidatus Helarchaeota archaeon]